MTLASPLRLTVRLALPTVGALARLRAWPVESQQRARRNAMVAATDCAQRRAEREDVADFLHAREPRSVLPADLAPVLPTDLVPDPSAARPADAAHG